MKSSVLADAFRDVADSVASRADDRQVFAFVLGRDLERSPSGSFRLRRRHPRLDADARAGISPRVAFYVVTDRHVTITWSQLDVLYQICRHKSLELYFTRDPLRQGRTQRGFTGCP